MFTGTFGYIGTTEIALVIGAVVLLFGGAKIPQLARGMGEGIREFKKSMDGSNDNTPSSDTTTTPAPKAESDETTTTTSTK